MLLPSSTREMKRLRSGPVVDRNEGISWHLHNKQCSHRLYTISQILDLADRRGFVLLNAPPQSGKTSLLQLIQHHYQEDVLCVNMMDKPQAMSWSDFFQEQTGQSWHQYLCPDASDQRMVYLLIDELRIACGGESSTTPDAMSDLWLFCKGLAGGKDAPLRIIAAAAWGDAPSGYRLLHICAGISLEITPDRLVWLHRSSADEPALAYTDEEFEEVWTATWAAEETSLFNGSGTKTHLLTITAGQPGLVAFILDALQSDLNTHWPGGVSEHRGDFLYWEMFRTGRLYEALKITRSFMALGDGSASTAAQLDLLHPLVEAGPGVKGQLEWVRVARLRPEQRAVLADCVKSGYLTCHEDLLQGQLYCCTTPLHLLYAQQQVASAHAHHVEPGQGSLPEFIRALVTQLSSAQLRETLGLQAGHSMGGPGSHVLLERKLQMELHSTAAGLVPRGWTVCPDAEEVYGPSGLVDMWVSSPDRKELWALEFLRNGSDLAEHEGRFEPGGKYSNLPSAQFAVIDFRAPASAMPRARPERKDTCFVLFEEGFQSASMYCAHDMSKVWGPDTLQG